MKHIPIEFICELQIVYRKHKDIFHATCVKYNLKGKSSINYETALNDLFDKIKEKLWLDEKYQIEYRLQENFEVEKTETELNQEINNSN